MTMVYGWICDIDDETVANSALTLERLVDEQVDLGKREIARWFAAGYPSQAWEAGSIRFLHRFWRHTHEAFDFEDEHGVMGHVPEYQTWRVEVTGGADVDWQ